MINITSRMQLLMLMIVVVVMMMMMMMVMTAVITVTGFNNINVKTEQPVLSCTTYTRSKETNKRSDGNCLTSDVEATTVFWSTVTFVLNRVSLLLHIYALYIYI